MKTTQRRSTLRGALALFALLLPVLGAGCAESDTTTVTLSIALPNPAPPPPSSKLGGPSGSQSPDFGVSRSALSYADVRAIRITVSDVQTGKVYYTNADLTYASATGWTGTLPFLHKNKSLNFVAKATDQGGNVLFEGQTVQTLVIDNTTVTVAMAPKNTDDISLARVVQISIPSEFTSGQSNNLTVAAEARNGERLDYAFTTLTGQGTFFPQTGTITLQNTSGSFVTQYVPPSVTADTTFTHQVKVTNSTGHSVTTTFTTRVKPPGSTNGVSNTGVQIIFNPIINAISAQRVAGSSNVVWTADVSDDKPLSAVTYAWSFTPTGTYSPAPALDPATAQSQTATLLNYSTAVQGTLTLSVTDGDNGTTTLRYPLTPNQFPDNPVQVGTNNGIRSIRAGTSHTCAVLNSGDMICWGAADVGQLGYGSTFSYGSTMSTLPYTAPVVPIGGVSTSVSLGGSHTCVVLSDGFVRCWGKGAFGQLGYNGLSNIGDDEPIYNAGYVNLGGNALKIASGADHTCALMETGNVRCWGNGLSGRLGYANSNNIGDTEAPWVAGDVQIGNTVQDIVAGGAHTCALLTNGKVRCWGLNISGQLGSGSVNNNIGDNEHPSAATDVNLGTVVQIAAGNSHTCALLETGNMRCWGMGSNGQLGYGNFSDVLAPTQDVNVGARVLQITAGEHHTCALLSTGGIKCWGLGNFGQLGTGSNATLNAPPAGTLSLGGATAYQISAGDKHTCALLSTGKARCWGLNASGQLGIGSTTPIGDNETPTTDVQLTAPTP
jgi:alpha-tubulin suppressor-like RCC1 family protein